MLLGRAHHCSPQGDRNWPEVTNRKRVELLHRFWEARRAWLRTRLAWRLTWTRAAQALESPATNFTHTPMRLIMEWHAEAHLLPPWERTVEVCGTPSHCACFSLSSHKALCAQVVSWLRRAARRRGCPVMLMTLVRHPVDLYARRARARCEHHSASHLTRTACFLVRSWYKYEGMRIAKGQGLLDWVADNPNLQARGARRHCSLCAAC